MGGGWMRWLTPVPLLAYAALSLSACSTRAPEATRTHAPPAQDSASATFDDEPAPSTPTLEDLRGVGVLETHAGGGIAYRIRLSDAPLRTVRYYGFPIYSDAIGAELLSPTEGGSEPIDAGYVAALVTPDDPARVAEWYQERLPDWRLVQLAKPNSDEVAEYILYQPPNGRRRICILPTSSEVAITLVGYQVYGDEAAPPLPLDPDAYRKWEHVLTLRLALDQYRADTGEVADSVSDLTAAEGPEGYQGPYLAGEAPLDPYTGEPYQIRNGEVVGPGDVTSFTF